MTRRRLNAGLLSLTIAIVAMGCNRAQTAAVRAPCPGCSPDGKTTPRTADGHPDLSGYWNGAVRDGRGPARGANVAGFGFTGGVFQRDSDGSLHMTRGWPGLLQGN